MTTEGAADLRMLYQQSAQDIALLKEQQWRVTNYALLLYGAAYGVGRAHAGFGNVLTGAVVLVLVLSLGLVEQLSRSVDHARNRLDAVRPLLSAEFQQAFGKDIASAVLLSVPNALRIMLALGALATIVLVQGG